MKTKFKNEKPSLSHGFTLIELLVVISIIGLLSSIILVALNGARQKGVQAAGQEFEHTAYSSLYNSIVMDYDFTNATCGLGNSISTPVPDSSPNGIALTPLNGPLCNGDTPVSGRTSVQFTASRRLYRDVNGGGRFTISGIDMSRLSVSFWLKTSISTIGSGTGGSLLALGGTTGNGFLVDLSSGYIVAGTSASESCKAAYPSDGNWHQVFVSMDSNSSDSYPGITIYVDGKSTSQSGTCTLSGWSDGLANGSNYLYVMNPNSATPILLNNLVFFAAAP